MTRAALAGGLTTGLLVLAALAGPVDAQPGRPTADVAPEQVATIARSLNCPLCQGYTLQECPLPVCAQMRAQIATRLAAGAAPAEIRDEFVALYGPQVLNAPPARGIQLAAWVAPVLVLGAGVYAGLRVARRRRGPPIAPAAVAAVSGTPGGLGPEFAAPGMAGAGRESMPAAHARFEALFRERDL
jgi:cytochrome c-type biogenesis protein CcmH